MVSFHRFSVRFRFRIVDLSFILGAICDRKLSPAVSHYCEISCDYFICLLRACQHSRQPKNTDLGKGKLFDKCHYTGFIDG